MISAIDLCSGPGGVTTGYKAAGVRILAAVDTDRDARETYALNHPEVALYPDDLLQLNPDEFLERLGLRPGDLDVLTACVPCQTFSSLGRMNRRSDDPRNRLVGRIARFAASLKPRAIVMENVPPLAKDVRFKRLVGQLSRLGYGVWNGVVDAADFGVPQKRRRLVLIALYDKKHEEVPELSSKNLLLKTFGERQTVREAFRQLKGARRADPLSRPRWNYPPLVAARIAAIPPDGGSRNSLPDELRLSCHQNLRHGAAASAYGRMQFDAVAPTLTTRCTTPACGRFLHPIENRAITLREAACLQTFPLDYRFKGGVMSIQAQIGNAVPPKLAEAIAILVRDALEKTSSSASRILPRDQKEDESGW